MTEGQAAFDNWVDPDATKPVDLGPCRCPGRPHTGDSATVVRLFSYAERGLIRQAGRLGGGEAFNLSSIARGTKAWTLVLPDGSPRPITTQEVNRLDERTVNILIEALDDAFAEDPLPNESGAPSPSGSQESATSTQTSPTPTSSTQS